LHPGRWRFLSGRGAHRDRQSLKWCGSRLFEREGAKNRGQVMRGRKGLSHVIIVFIGIAIGIGISLLAGQFLCYADSGTLLSSRPRKFGDIKVLATENHKNQNVYKTLMMSKNDFPFLAINQNEPDKIDVLVLLNDKEKAVLSMKPLDTPGRWGQVMYGRSNEAGKLMGDVFVDIDFDGQFDVKHVMDDKGERVSAFILINDVWQEVSSFSIKDMKAGSGEKTYIFDSNTGWR